MIIGASMLSCSNNNMNDNLIIICIPATVLYNQYICYFNNLIFAVYHLTLHSMMKILLVIVLVLFPNLINAQSEYCTNGDLNIKNSTEDSQETEFGTYETVSGVLEICYNNSYSNICLNTSDVNAAEVAEIACNNFGYYGKFFLFIT